MHLRITRKEVNCSRRNLPVYSFLPEGTLVSMVKVKVKLLSLVPLFGIPWTVVYQASLSMGFSRQEYWSGLPFPSPGDLPDPGIKPGSPTLQADALTSEPPGKPMGTPFLGVLALHKGIIPDFSFFPFYPHIIK